MADDKTLDVVYLDVEVRKAPDMAAGLRRIGVEGRDSLHITQLAAEDLSKAIKGAGDQVNITRRLYQAGAKDANTFEKEMRELDTAIKHLIETQELDTEQLLKLSGAARTAQASLDVYEGKITKLGLAHNVAIANGGKFNTQILDMIPGVSSLSGQLGIMQGAGLSAGAMLGGGLAIGAGIAVNALQKAARAAAEVADELDKNAARSGVAVEEYQRLVYWADQNGISQDQLRQGLGDLNTRVGQAVAGNKNYAKSFEQLGINLKDSNGITKNTDTILRDLVERLSQTENAAERTALAGAAFGEEFSRVVQPALEGGISAFDDMRERANELGLVLSEQSVNELVAYKDRMAEVDKAVEFAKIQIGTAFLPILENLANFTLNSVVPAMRDFAGWLDSVTTNVSNATSAVNAFTTNPNLRNFVTMFNQLNPFTKGLPTENDILNMVGQSDFSGGTMVGGGWGGKAPPPPTPDLWDTSGSATGTRTVAGAKTRTVADALSKYNQELALNNTLTSEAARIDANLSSSKSFLNQLLNPDVKGDRSGLVAQLESEISALEGRKEAFKDQEQAAKDFERSMQSLTSAYDKYNAKFAELQSDFSRGNISQEELDKQQLSLVQGTIRELETFARAGLLTEYGQSFLSALLESEQVIKRILAPIDVDKITLADRQLASAAPGNPFNETLNLPTPKARAKALSEVIGAYDLALAEYQRDTVGLGLMGKSTSPAAMSLIEAIDAYDLAVAEYIRDGLGLGIEGGNYGSVSLDRPAAPPARILASSISANDLLSAEYMRDIVGEGLFGSAFEPLIKERLKTTTEAMLEALSASGDDIGEYMRDTVGLGIDSKGFSSAPYEIVSALDNVDLMLAEYIRQSAGIAINSNLPTSIGLGRTSSDRVTQNLLGLGLQDFANMDAGSLSLASQMGMLNLGPDGANADSIDFFKKSIEGGADTFASTVVDAAGQVGSVFTSIISGKATAGGVVSGLGGAAAGIVGTINPLAGQIVGVASGFLGGIFDAFGDSDKKEEQARLANQNRQLPSITFDFMIEQSNTYTGAPVDARAQAQYSQNAFELAEVIFKSIEPRLGRVEKAVGI